MAVYQPIKIYSFPKVFGFFQIDCTFNAAAISDTKPLTYKWDKHNFSINVQQGIDRLLVLNFWLLIFWAHITIKQKCKGHDSKCSTFHHFKLKNCP